MDEARGFLTVRMHVHAAFAPDDSVRREELAYWERIEGILKDGPLSLSELSREMGYKSIPKRLARAVERMAGEGRVAKVAAGGVRSKLALVVRS